MTDHPLPDASLDAFARHAGGYVSAASLLADIADSFTGTGDPFFDDLSDSYKRQSRACLCRAVRSLTPNLRATA